MALPTYNVSGFLTKPDGTKLKNGQVVFTLSDVASDYRFLIPHSEVEVFTGSDGFFSVDLWSNDDYVLPSYYNVVGYDWDEATETRGKGYSFGKVIVPVGGGNITDMIGLLPRARVSDTATYYKGETLYIPMILANSYGLPINLSGYTVSAHIIPPRGDPPLVTATIADSSKGMIDIEGDTSDFEIGVNRLRVVLTNAYGTKIHGGNIKVVQ